MIGATVAIGSWGTIIALVALGWIRDLLRQIDRRSRPEPTVARTVPELERLYHQPDPTALERWR